MVIKVNPASVLDIIQNQSVMDYGGVTTLDKSTVKDNSKPNFKEDVNDTCSGISGYSGHSGYSGECSGSGFSGYSGTSGFSGYSGTSGYSGVSGRCDFCDQKAVLVSTSYDVQPDDFYVGLNSEGPTTQTLPAVDTVDDCIMKIIKVSMGPPIGNRKVTVNTADGVLIDGESKYIMQSPYESITVILQGGEWHLVSHFLP